MTEPDERRDDEVVDELPEDLDAAGYVGPYVFPDNNRRRIPGYLYLLTAAACIAVWAVAGDDAVLVNEGFVLVDGVDGAIVDQLVEDNPEDWSDLDGKLTA